MAIRPAKNSQAQSSVLSGGSLAGGASGNPASASWCERSMRLSRYSPRQPMARNGRLLSTSIALGRWNSGRLSANTEAIATSAAGSAGPKKAISKSSAKVNNSPRSRRVRVGRSMAFLGGVVAGGWNLVASPPPGIENRYEALFHSLRYPFSIPSTRTLPS
ncbi:hypothetical protein D9M69_555280 [compost metagenome]